MGISFSNSTAHWIPFSVDKDIQRAFATLKSSGKTEAHVKDFSRVAITTAESSVFEWIIRRICEREHRSTAFRALGRGWVFVLVNLHMDKFRWWFEALDSVFSRHKFELNDLGLDERQLEKYTYGYNCNSEVVFLLKSSVAGNSCKSSITLMKVRDNCMYTEKWAPSEEVLRHLHKADNAWPDDAQLEVQAHAHAMKTQQRKAYRQRVKQKRAKAKDGAPAIEVEPDHNLKFDELLAELKSEMAGAEPARSLTSMSRGSGRI